MSNSNPSTTMFPDLDKDDDTSDFTIIERIIGVVMCFVGVFVLLWILHALSYGGIGFLGGIDQLY